MKRIPLTLIACALAAFSPAARAESERWGAFELQAGEYRPDIDSEFSVKPGPWETVFGSKRGWMFRLGAARAVYTGFGSLEVGAQVGYFQRSGFGQLISGGASGDETAFHVIPTSATLTYRFDWLADRYRVPLAPYGRVALERYNWWITDGAGSSSKSGATHGWSASAGLALLLDVFDPTLARELDADTGINHTYLFAELKKSSIDDFGSGSSWNLSDDRVGLSFGLLFVF